MPVARAPAWCRDSSRSAARSSPVPCTHTGAHTNTQDTRRHGHTDTRATNQTSACISQPVLASGSSGGRGCEIACTRPDAPHLGAIRVKALPGGKIVARGLDSRTTPTALVSQVQYLLDSERGGIGTLGALAGAKELARGFQHAAPVLRARARNHASGAVIAGQHRAPRRPSSPRASRACAWSRPAASGSDSTCHTRAAQRHAGGTWRQRVPMSCADARGSAQQRSGCMPACTHLQGSCCVLPSHGASRAAVCLKVAPTASW